MSDDHDDAPASISRRKFVGGVGAGALGMAAALGAESAQPQPDDIA